MSMVTLKIKHPVHNWKQFAKHVRSKGCNLLSNLYEYPDSVLVSGCQRSGTTAVTNTITTSDGMINYWYGKDSELDAALLLSGYTTNKSTGRFCFQTTYLNECVGEYLKYSSEQKIIWVVRNPHSVVYSMLHNWGRFAFNELFNACGAPLLTPEELRNYRRFGRFSIPRIKRACLSYNAKTSQILMLREELQSDSILVVDYDDLMLNVSSKLEEIYNFIQLPFNAEYTKKLHVSSMKKANKFSHKEKNYIDDLCTDTYHKVKAMAI